MCNECGKECIGVTPCGNCNIMRKKLENEMENENEIKFGDILTIVLIVVVCYLWAIAG